MVFCLNTGALMLYSSISFKELISFGFSLMLRQFTPLKQLFYQSKTTYSFESLIINIYLGNIRNGWKIAGRELFLAVR